ncbi:methionine ABC transporter ATP-binding protein [Roseateles terrae]|uniref:D-methionine transport system ATP-binding protein n=1 Tax=Roseateles terrae TaxID=431060 RepID=A0ABR6GR74_9BURK|nr:ATP-binding cassette domain-containing protein [Roseateles terrae]MBB3193663.1 D-methionine transport system ATP-binding protein [Roseateles terrae]OWQ89177.1 ABC transporter ATP-binding protein [Roseateles terrae]
MRGAADAPPLISLQQVHRSFDARGGRRLHAVRNVDLTVQPGEVLGIIGRSGAGKSTLLRMINLLERPDQGRVQVAGQTLTDLSARELRRARSGIGMIFQQFNLLQNATVADNVALPLQLQGHWSRSRIDTRVAECLAQVGLVDKADAYPAQLSGGQKQRVAIARALAPRPAVMLCDEPTSALDAETTREVLSTLHAVNRELGVTLVIVTHELSVVLKLCQRVAVMQAGQLVEQFATSEAAQGQSALARELAALAAAHAGSPGVVAGGSTLSRRPSTSADLRAEGHARVEMPHA